MAASPFVPIDEYLSRSYRPDCDYIDGEVRERNVGLMPHARTMAVVGFLLSPFQKDTDTVALLSVRVRVSGERVLVPDVCLARRVPRENVIVTPPLLCVEIAQPEDTLRSVVDRASDYRDMGVEHVWVIDPWTRRGYVASVRGLEHPQDAIFAVPGTAISLSLAEVFSELDETP